MDADRNKARIRRIRGYAQWLDDDAQGIAAALLTGEPLPESTALLAEARESVALTLARLDRAIELDRKAHQEHA